MSITAQLSGPIPVTNRRCLLGVPPALVPCAHCGKPPRRGDLDGCICAAARRLPIEQRHHAGLAFEFRNWFSDEAWEGDADASLACEA